MPSQLIEPTSDIGEMISDFVSKAAEKLNLKPVLWYHGEPIWFVEKRENEQERSLVRRVQITLNSHSGKRERLYFVPQIFSIPKTGGVIKALEKIDTKNINSLGLEKGLEFGEFSRKVFKAWEIADKYDPDQLDYEIPRIAALESSNRA